MISIGNFYVQELIHLPVLNANYGAHHIKPVCMGIFQICMVVGEQTVF
jgi:hypothetical protein